MTTSADSVVIIQISESDYCYGLGPVKLRVKLVDRANPVRYDGDTFYRVEGEQLSPNGVELGHRAILVRGRRLPPLPR